MNCTHARGKTYATWLNATLNEGTREPDEENNTFSVPARRRKRGSDRDLLLELRMWSESSMPALGRGRGSVPGWKPSPLKVLIKEVAEHPPWVPDFRFTVRLLLIARVVAALNATISDCDETFNYWEPLHLLSHPPRPLGTSQAAFQTWEYAPQYAIRSWTYLLQYLPIPSAVRWILRREKSACFYAVRIFLGICSALSEALFVQSIAEHISRRAARYTLVFLLFSAGMFASSTALLPSTFATYATTVASAYSLRPAVEGADRFVINHSLPAASIRGRSMIATAAFAIGALLGWPFALVLSLPFVFEQIFLPSGLLVPAKRYGEFVWVRTRRWFRSVIIAAAAAVPIFAIDSIAYGRPVLVPLQIIAYNILSAKRGAGPTLYGTEPWYYYLLNLALNFGPALGLALSSLPLLIITSWSFPESIEWAKQASSIHADQKKTEGGGGANRHIASTPLCLLLLRILPSYLWLLLLSAQPHKEERFLYPAYPLLYLNAAVALLCVRIWLNGLLGAGARGSEGKRIVSQLPALFCRTAILVTCAFSILRIVNTISSYRAPIAVLEHLTKHELPRIIAYTHPNRQSSDVRERLASGLQPVLSVEEVANRSWTDNRQDDPFVDVSQLVGIANAQKEDEVLRLCYGKEWHRFPTTYLVPDGVAVDFIKSDFDGILPKHFDRQDRNTPGDRSNALAVMQTTLWPWRFATSASRTDFNDLNREEPDQYVDVSSCDYLVDVKWHDRKAAGVSKHEPDYVDDRKKWVKAACIPFLDAAQSRAPLGASLASKIRATFDRSLWVPSLLRGNTNQYGEYCLLRTTRRKSLANVEAPSMTK